MNLFERISCQLYNPYGVTKFYELKHKVIFVTRMHNYRIYDISYLKYYKISENIDEILLSIRNTSYRVCNKDSMLKYIKLLSEEEEYDEINKKIDTDSL